MDVIGESAPKTSPMLAWAMIVGGIAFLTGFVGPVQFSDSNLGPLLGIFITGPLGFLAGALIGILISARQKAPQSATREVKWLAGAWLGVMLFTLAISTGGIGWISIGAQLAIAACAAALFYLMPQQLPPMIRKSRSIVLLGAALVLATSIYPPVNSTSGMHPPFALFLDDRFDASTRVPDYTIDSASLVISWLIIAMAGVILVLRLRESTKHPPA